MHLQQEQKGRRWVVASCLLCHVRSTGVGLWTMRRSGQDVMIFAFMIYPLSLLAQPKST
jgi:hypothetical protein